MSNSLFDGALLVPPEREDALPPNRPILWVQEIDKASTNRRRDENARQCRHPTRGGIVGPIPLLETALHASNQRSHRLSRLGDTGSDLVGSVTILAPQRLHAPSPILTL